MVWLKAGMRAQRLYGLTRDVSRIGLVIDDLEGFRRAMEAAPSH